MKLLQIATLVMCFTLVSVLVVDAAQSEPKGISESSQNAVDAKHDGGFFSGLVAPVGLIWKGIGCCLGSGGAQRFNALWNSTWGQGAVSYRIGFVIGSIILLSILAGGGGAVANKASQVKDKDT